MKIHFLEFQVVILLANLVIPAGGFAHSCYGHQLVVSSMGGFYRSML